MLTIETLARFQFGMTTIFHFFFVPLSIGLTLMAFIMEALYVKTGDEKWKTRTKFFGTIMLLSFAVGVVTGIIQEFQFGMNWSDYSRFVGDIFGAPLAVEALLAFFMESTFLGVWIFGWDRLGKKLHLAALGLVMVGTWLSSLWILAANSFMQNPVGYEVIDGRATLTSFTSLLTNPQTTLEFTHVITGAFLTGGFAVAGISAFQILKKREVDFFKPALRLGLLVALLGAMGNFVAGDQQMLEVRNTQPMKFSATEGVYEKTEDPAAWDMVAFFNEADHKSLFGVRIPYLLSILTYHRPSGAVEGMNDINKELQAKYGDHQNYYPPVTVLFYTFRIMAGLSMYFMLISALGLFWTRRKKPWMYEKPGMMRLYGWSMFLPFVAITSGWLVTELGRYPWTVYGLFTIKDSVSPNVSVGSLLFSNIVYFILFCVLGTIMIILSRRVMRESAHKAETAYVDLDPFSSANLKEKKEKSESKEGQEQEEEALK
ncbi:cytochrome ubiquinol oxidase subunit I [Lactococcus garvieae]|jgi:cytochrome d ubiquinol oxidase subunit I|uniref:Cytochrome d ubiquinol oxidase subunit I n=1 Tax=Lactococcus garvieae DCC43 TaxID=1231377 RepID=K2PUW0_9LACT|nr:cytochrome ubiquinol oxidase subunit I [Lactococcus garvieae]EKF51231.1 Cytochrome d ubiquinol oxidase subunit I [Lactococcus garvieae DCC43]QPS70277.1 cytochrome ubiquinol oxidase subunit I [Lactococcus garvieae]